MTLPLSPAPSGTPAETVSLEVEFPGGSQGRTLVRGRVAVPSSLTVPAGPESPSADCCLLAGPRRPRCRPAGRQRWPAHAR